MSYKVVIFDLDGTLLDTLEDLAISFNHVLIQNGFPSHPMSSYRYFIGHGATACLLRILPEHERNLDTIQFKYLEQFKTNYYQNWDKKTKVYDGIYQLLDALVESKIHTAVLSNKPHEITVKCIGKFFQQVLFSIVLGQIDSQPIKPDPIGALTIADKLQVLPSECLFVGDTSVDMQTAQNAGMIPVGATWGYRTVQELEKSGACHIIHQPLELLELMSE